MAIKKTSEYYQGKNVFIIHLKCVQQAFDDVKSGIKRFELRIEDDHKFTLGDHIILYRMNSKNEVEEYSPTLRMRVNYIFREAGYGLEIGHAILGIEPILIQKARGYDEDNDS